MKFRQRSLPVYILMLALLGASCSQAAKQAPPAAASPAPQPAVAPAVPPPDKEQGLDERAVAAAQRALTQLGYAAGTADGVIGPSTRRAIMAFQKDHGLAEDGRLSLALAAMLNTLAAQSPKINTTSVSAGDTLLFGDGSKEVVKADRVVAWDEAGRGLVAIRPSTAGWPPAARAGLDWAITHALDVAGSAPLAWSSTGVDQHFDIHAGAALSPRETALAGPLAPNCRHFELQNDQRRYPGLACRDPDGEWYFLHSRIRLAHPARRLGPQAESAARPH